jgi:hypothetical protein
MSSQDWRPPYSLRIAAPGFALFQKTDLVVMPHSHQRLNVTLSATIEKQEVTIQSRSVSTESRNNASQIVLRDEELNALPDDPDELAAALQALAGPSSGPNFGSLPKCPFNRHALEPDDHTSDKTSRVASTAFAVLLSITGSYTYGQTFEAAIRLELYVECRNRTGLPL